MTYSIMFIYNKDVSLSMVTGVVPGNVPSMRERESVCVCVYVCVSVYVCTFS